MAGNDLGTRIRRARERRGWSQRELADALTAQRGGKAVGVRSVGRWERGEAEPRNAIGALEEVLGVDLSGNEQAPVYLHPDEARVWSWDTQYSEDERHAMIAALRATRSGPGRTGT